MDIFGSISLIHVCKLADYIYIAYALQLRFYKKYIEYIWKYRPSLHVLWLKSLAYTYIAYYISMYFI